MLFLREDSAFTFRFGPCLDVTDGVTEETSLTLAQADMRISKNGNAFAQKSAAGNATHDSDGWYSTTLSTADTDTQGNFIFNVHQPANMLPVFIHGFVINTLSYDAIFSSFANSGWDGSGDVTVTGHTAQTGDSFARIGVAGAGLTDLAQAAVMGALATAASTGDIDTSTTAIAYLKQLLNELSGSVGIGTMPTLLDPANGANLFEVIRAGLGATFASATDSLEQLQADIVTAQSDLDNIQTRLPTALVGARMDSDIGAIALAGIEPTGVPAHTVSMEEKVDYIYAALIEEQTLNRSTGARALRNSADTGDISTATDSDDGTTTVRGQSI